MNKISSMLFLLALLALPAFAQGDGTIKVVTQAPDNVIYVDGVKLGTGSVFTVTQAGTHEVIVDMPTGQELYAQDVIVNEAETTLVDVPALVPALHVTPKAVVPQTMEAAVTTVEAPVSSKILGSGTEYKLQISNYYYEEPDTPSMRLGGTMYGLDVTSTSRLARMMTRLEAMLSTGLQNYSGSARINSIPSMIGELRLLLGYDLVSSDTTALTTYIGCGLRDKTDNSAAVDDTGFMRESNYSYVPIGIEYDSAINSSSYYKAMIEYDYFLGGRQTNFFSETGTTESDTSYNQKTGYGARCSLGYYFKDGLADFAAEIFGRYWNIDKSEEVATAPAGYPDVPRNDTTEIGLSFNLAF